MLLDQYRIIRRILARFLGIVLSIFFTTLAYAQDVESPKVVFVNFGQVVQESALGQEIEKRFLAAADQANQQQSEIAEAIRREEIELTEKRSTMTFEEFQPLGEEFDNKVELYRREFSLVDGKIKEDRQGQNQRMLSLIILPETEKMRQDIGLDFVLQVQAAAAFNPTLDYTDILIERMDRLYQTRQDALNEVIFLDRGTESAVSMELQNQEIQSEAE